MNARTRAKQDRGREDLGGDPNLHAVKKPKTHKTTTGRLLRRLNTKQSASFEADLPTMYAAPDLTGKIALVTTCYLDVNRDLVPERCERLFGFKIIDLTTSADFLGLRNFGNDFFY